ncbi:MAG TPA: sugar transferase [Anaerolineales bacterium]|nr:sugar transferase [Anaerolineales bacterium]
MPISDQDEKEANPSRRRSFGIGMAGCLLTAAGWLGLGALPAGMPAPTLVAAEIALAAAAAFSLHRLLAGASGRRSAGSYRLAILLALAVGSAALAVRPATGPWMWIGILVGAFCGALVASWRDAGVWEDNFPPPAEVTGFVLEAHRARPLSSLTLPAGKRLFDVVVAGAGLLVLSPVLLAVCLWLWLEDPGPLFFVKNSVGRGGRNFRQWKLRTMVRGAEAESGPIWAEKTDQRVLRSGSLLRRTALDELPQLANILAGQMSVVGPRPQRTILVAEYLREIPAYADRHRLPPGLAGLAQVAGHYYITPRQKLRFDLLYIEHAGLAFDLRLLLIAFGVVFWLRWRRGWVGRLPRSWLHRRRRGGGSG